MVGCKTQEKKKNKESKAKHCRASHFVKSISLGEFIFRGTKRVATQYSRVFGVSKHPSPLHLPVPQSNSLSISVLCSSSFIDPAPPMHVLCLGRE